MKNTLIILFFLWAALALAQTEKIKIKKEVEKKTSKKNKKQKNTYYEFRSFDLVYGQKVYAKNFYSQLNTFDSLKTDLPLKFIGVGFSGYQIEVNPRNDFIIKMYWNFAIPEEIKIQDSLKNTLSGFCYNFGVGKALSTKKKVLSITFYLGFNTGLIKTSNKQLNPFFSPDICIQPKLTIKRFTISTIIDIEYDVTNPKWRTFKSVEQSIALRPFNQTGISIIGTLGFRLFNR